MLISLSRISSLHQRSTCNSIGLLLGKNIHSLTLSLCCAVALAPSATILLSQNIVWRLFWWLLALFGSSSATFIVFDILIGRAALYLYLCVSILIYTNDTFFSWATAFNALLLLLIKSVRIQFLPFVVLKRTQTSHWISVVWMVVYFNRFVEKIRYSYDR